MSKGGEQEKPYHLTQAEIEALREDSRNAINQLMNMSSSPNPKKESSMNQKSRESMLNMDEGRAAPKTVEELWQEGKLGKGGSNESDSETESEASPVQDQRVMAPTTTEKPYQLTQSEKESLRQDMKAKIDKLMAM